eukprot:7236920-Prymnesium_polylepis.1
MGVARLAPDVAVAVALDVAVGATGVVPKAKAGGRARASFMAIRSRLLVVVWPREIQICENIRSVSSRTTEPVLPGCLGIARRCWKTSTDPLEKEATPWERPRATESWRSAASSRR